jgi:hypothetical protein
MWIEIMAAEQPAAALGVQEGVEEGQAGQGVLICVPVPKVSLYRASCKRVCKKLNKVGLTA